MGFIRVHGRVVHVNDNFVSSTAKNAGVSKNKIKHLAGSRGIDLKRKLNSDQKNELSFKATQIFGSKELGIKGRDNNNNLESRSKTIGRSILGGAKVGGYLSSTAVASHHIANLVVLGKTTANFKKIGKVIGLGIAVGSAIGAANGIFAKKRKRK